MRGYIRERSMSTARLEGEPPARCCRQDTESEAVSDHSVTLDSVSLSSSSDAAPLSSHPQIVAAAWLSVIAGWTTGLTFVPNGHMHPF